MLGLQFLHHIVQLMVQLQDNCNMGVFLTHSSTSHEQPDSVNMKKSVISYHAHFLVEDISQV